MMIRNKLIRKVELFSLSVSTIVSSECQVRLYVSYSWFHFRNDERLCYIYMNLLELLDIE